MHGPLLIKPQSSNYELHIRAHNIVFYWGGVCEVETDRMNSENTVNATCFWPHGPSLLFSTSSTAITLLTTLKLKKIKLNADHRFNPAAFQPKILISITVPDETHSSHGIPNYIIT